MCTSFQATPPSTRETRFVETTHVTKKRTKMKAKAAPGETKIECPTTEETVDNGELDNCLERIAHLPPAHEIKELATISALPRKFTLMISTHESEEIIEEDTRPPSTLSKRRGTKKRKKMSTSAVPSSRRKNSSSFLSKS